MAKSLPYYPMYVVEFDDDQHVVPMTLPEIGLYLLCLNESWKRGSIPDDPKAVAMAIRKEVKDVKKAWPIVRQRWVENGTPGRLINPRQEKERKKAVDRSIQAADAARAKHASAPKQHVRPQPSGTCSTAADASAESAADATAVSVQRAFKSSLSSDSKEDTTNKQTNIHASSEEFPVPSGFFLDELHAEFRSACGWLGLIPSDFTGPAWLEWGRLDRMQRMAAIEGIRTLEKAGAEPGLVKRPRRYLADREWLRRPSTAPRKSKLDQLMEAI